MTFYKNTKIALIICAALTAIGFTHTSTAAAGWFLNNKISTTLNDVNYGGCMIFVDEFQGTAFDGVVLNCPSYWVSMDCDALFHTQAQSNAMWSSTLMAFSLQKNINIYVDDTQKVNGYCVAQRIDVSR